MKILAHNLRTGEFTQIEGKSTLQTTLKLCAELNERNKRIKHYPIKGDIKC